jgi:hypothetical protein
MSVLRLFVIPLVAALAGATALAAQDAPKPPAKDQAKPAEEVLRGIPDDKRDATGLRRISETSFVHEASQVGFRIPAGWKEIRPHRLERVIDPRVITLLGIERADRELVASIYFIPMNPDQDLSRWVRETPTGGEYGEEYETLKTVYGRDHVTIPARFKSGPFDVYRINIAGGPPGPEKYDGTLFAFAVESGGTTWLVKARISYPHGDKVQTDAWAMEVLQGFSKLPGATAVGAKKAGTEEK